MSKEREKLWRLCMTLASGSVVDVLEPVKMKKLQLDSEGKKIGEYEEVQIYLRQAVVPPMKEALEVLARLAEQEMPKQTVEHCVPRPE